MLESNFIKNLLINSVVVLSIGLAFAAVSSAGSMFPSEIEAVGEGAIEGGNEVKAREKATLDAVSKALFEYLSEGLGEKVVREYSARIRRGVLPRVENVVENFLVLSEYIGGDRLEVFLRVKFNRDLVEDLLRDAGVPLHRAGERNVYPSQTIEPGGVRVISLVFESDGALIDSTFLERYISDKVSGIESVRTARLSNSRVVFEIAFRGNPAVLAGRLAAEWAPFRVESTLEGENTIKLRRSNSDGPSGDTGYRLDENAE